MAQQKKKNKNTDNFMKMGNGRIVGTRHEIILNKSVIIRSVGKSPFRRNFNRIAGFKKSESARASVITTSVHKQKCRR
jgi:hypothetical protein